MDGVDCRLIDGEAFATHTRPPTQGERIVVGDVELSPAAAGHVPGSEPATVGGAA